jgi:hypothetical protein
VTLVVCWREADSITVAADTRISQVAPGGGALPYTDGGPKIFTVPMVVHQNVLGKPQRRSLPNFGFAFAGSSLIAQSVHALASICLQNLSGALTGDGPSLRQVADLYMRCSVQYTKEMLSWRPHQYPALEAFIFGYCPNLKDYLVYHLRTTVDDGVVNLRHDGHYVEEGSAFHIGSGVSEFIRVFEEHKERREPLTPFENFELVITGRKVPSVGGSRQYASASRDGVELRPALIPVEGDAFSCRIEALGCDLSELGSVGEYAVGHHVIGPKLAGDM